MWRSFSRVDGKLEAEEEYLSISQTRLDGRSCSSLPRQLWIWIHPATASQGLDAIRYACAKQIQDSGGVVKCCSLEGKVARLELMGSMAMQSLKSILHPVNNSNMISMVLSTCNSSTSTDPSLGSTTGSHLRKAPVVDHAEILQPHAILPMTVRDPREVSVEKTDSPSKIVPNQENKVLEGRDLVPNTDEAPPEEGNIFFLSDCSDLWDSSHNLNPPVIEEILSMEKHHRHLKSFCLNCGNDPGQTQAKDCFSRSCSVLLLKHAKEGSIFPGWSVILPLSWVKPFWLFLVSHGAHAVGLRERRWIASKFKMPCFSYDYPWRVLARNLVMEK